MPTSWNCTGCSLTNSPSSDVCTACFTPAPPKSLLDTNVLFIESWIRLENVSHIPSDIVQLFHLFLQGTSKALKFHDTFRSVKDCDISEDGTHVKISSVGNLEFPYVLADIKPITSGVHCWRMKTVTTKRWMVWAVSQKKRHSQHPYRRAFGVSKDACDYYPADPTYYQHREPCDKMYFRNLKVGDVDMLLDADAGTLRLCVVGHAKPRHEVKLYNLPIPNEVAGHTGWVPCGIFGYAGQQLRVSSIPREWYGHRRDCQLHCLRV